MYHRTLSYSEYEIVNGSTPLYKITVTNEKTVSIFKWVESHYSFQESFWAHSILISEDKQHFLFTCDSLSAVVKYLGPEKEKGEKGEKGEKEKHESIPKLISFTPKSEMVSIQNDGIGWDTENNCYFLGIQGSEDRVMIHHSCIPSDQKDCNSLLQLFDSIGMVPLAIYKKDDPIKEKDNVPIIYRKYSVSCPFDEITRGESYMYKTKNTVRAFTRSACKNLFDEFAKEKFEPIQVKKGKSIKN